MDTMLKIKRLSFPIRSLLLLCLATFLVCLITVCDQFIKKIMLREHRLQQQFESGVRGYDAIIEGIERNDIQSVKFLTSRNIEINKVYNLGEHVDAYGHYIEYNANYGRPFLVIAAADGRKEIMALLLKRRADPNAESDDGWTPLLMAVSEHRIDMVRLLLQYNANPNLKSRDGQSPLAYALWENRVLKENNAEMIATLKQANAKE